MRATILFAAAVAAGCYPVAAQREQPAAVEAPILALTVDEIRAESVADPITFKKKVDAGRVRMRLRVDTIGSTRRGDIELIQFTPRVVAIGKIDAVNAKPGDAVSVVGRLAKIDAKEVTLRECRTE